MMAQIKTILRKRWETKVVEMRVDQLDPSKCSFKFLSHNFPADKIVFVRCDNDGNPIFRGAEKQYSILKPDAQ